MIIFLDLLILNFSLAFTIANDLNRLQDRFLYFHLISFSLIGIGVYLLNGQYKSISRFVGSREIYKLIIRNLFLTFLIGILNTRFNIFNLSTYKLFQFWVTINGLIGISRLISRDFLISLSKSGNLKPRNSIIYGAGMAGVQLMSLLRLSKKEKIKFFVDDDPKLWNREINGIRILSKKDLKKIIKREAIDQILLAIPSLKPSQRRNLFNDLKEFKIPILKIPSLDDINHGIQKISYLETINIEDILGRDEVIADQRFLDFAFKDKTICIFGAAGSIGFEICKQLFRQRPKALILFDHNEFGLYNLIQYFLGYKRKGQKWIWYHLKFDKSLHLADPCLK